MASARRIVIEFLGKDTSLSRTANSAEKSTNRWGTTLGKVGKVAALGLGAGVVVAGKAMFDMTKNAVEDEAAQRKLAVAMRNSVGANKEQIAAVEEWISAQGRALGVTDDEMRPAFQQLVQSTGSVAEAQKQMSVAMDVAAGTGKSLGTVTTAMMKANNGTTSSLSRLGLKTQDAAGNTLTMDQAMSKMAATFKGQAEKQANSLEGKMGRLKLIFDETKETIGAKLIPIVTKMADWFLNKGLPAIEKFGGWIRDNLFPIFNQAKAIVQRVMSSMSGDVGGNMGRIKGIIKDAVSIIRSLWNRFGKNILEVLRATFNNLRQIVGGGLKIISGIFKVFSSLLKGDWKGVWAGIKDILRGAWQVIIGLLKQAMSVVKFLIKAAWSVVTAITKAAFNGLVNLAKNGFTALVNYIRGIPGRIRTLAGSFGAAGKALIGALVNGLKNAAGVIGGIAGNVWNAVRGLLNGAISRINAALSFTIHLPGPDLSINPPDIPHLARGGIVNRPTLALIGEAGPEAVIPLSGPHAPRGAPSVMNVYNVTVNGALDPNAVGKQIETLLLKRQRITGRTVLGLMVAPGMPTLKVEIAFTSNYTTAAASRTWTDVSDYVVVGSAGEVTISRGRGDERSTVEPSQLTLTLDNRDGRFTPEYASGAYYPNVKKGRPIRVTATHSAVDYPRFLGYVEEWPVAWPDGTDNICHVTVTAVSRTARIALGSGFQNVVALELLSDDPIAYYPMGEPVEKNRASDYSGNALDKLEQDGTGTAVAFGTQTGPGTDGLPAPLFSAGKHLAADYNNPAAASTSRAMGIAFNTAGVVSQSLMLSEDYAGVSGAYMELRLNAAGKVTGDNNGSTITSANSYNDGATHWAEQRISGVNTTLWVDGVNVGSAVVGATSWQLTSLIVGNDFTGTLAQAVVHNTAPSDTRMADRAEAVLTGFEGDTAGATVTRIAGYAAIPPAEVTADAGSTTGISFLDTKDASALDLMRQVEATENGVLFDGKDGTLTFKGRDARYVATSSFTLSCTTQEVEGNLDPRLDDQGMVNEVTATRSDEAADAVRLVNTSSQSEYGIYRQDRTLVSTSDGDVQAAAEWLVNTYGTPRVRVPSVSVDWLNASTTNKPLILAADIGTRLTLSGLPAQAPASSMDLFIEGYTETFSNASYRFTFNTSSADLFDVWIVEDPVYGVIEADHPISY